MKRIFPLVLLALAACVPQVPNSAAGVGAGVGFDAYENYGTEAPGEGEEQEPIFTFPAPAGSASVPTLDNPGISDEQDFEAVSDRQTIESDAARLERLRREYQVIQPRPVPERSGDGGPNIVAFALETSHPVGQQVYQRLGREPSREQYLRRCAAYVSADAAQRAFLEQGGPERDRRGLDPDGDGYACLWDPAPFRVARR